MSRRCTSTILHLIQPARDHAVHSVKSKAQEIDGNRRPWVVTDRDGGEKRRGGKRRGWREDNDEEQEEDNPEVVDEVREEKEDRDSSHFLPEKLPANE